MFNAIHLDLKTSHYRREYLAGLLSRLAAAGYSHAVFEIEDKVRLDSTAGAVWHEAWTKEAFADLLATCRAAGLQPVPLVQTVGHLEFLLSRSRYHHLRECRGDATQICPSSPDARAFLLRLVDEVIELFDNPGYVHLGADEAYWLGHCPRCRERVAASSVSALYLEHLGVLADRVRGHGARPMAWADMVLAHPEALDRIERDFVWVDWDYGSGDGIPDTVRAWGDRQLDADAARNHPRRVDTGRFWFGGEELRPWPYVDYLVDRGFEVVVAPASRSYGDSAFVPRFTHLPNIVGAAARCHRDPAPHGLLLTSWALRLNTLESQWPALCLPGHVHDAATRFADLRTSGIVDPALFAAWQKLGDPPPNTFSVLGIDSPSFYYGPALPADVLAKRWLADGFPAWGRLDAATARRRLAAAIADCDAAAGLLADCAPVSGSDCLAFWRFAARAHHHRANELLLALGGDADPADLLLEAEALRDEYADLLEPIYTPGSIHRELQMIFAATTRHLASRQ